MKKYILFTLILSLSCALGYSYNNKGFIYGKVTTISGKSYQGAIRWGEEEVFWFDFFNGTKTDDFFSRYIHSRDQNSSHDSAFRQLDGFIAPSKRYNNRKQFNVEFGYIKSIVRFSSDLFYVTMQNDKRFKVENGSNDFDSDIYILDKGIGEVKLSIREIQSITFIQESEEFQSFGQALYGEVATRNGDKFTGYVQWDHDERLTTDILDGDSDEGKMKIPFGNIKSIKSKYDGSYITLKTGRKIFLSNSNDVNNRNKGVIVNIPDVGRVDIPWKQFTSVNFFMDHDNSGDGYDYYNDVKRLVGTVKSKNKKSHIGGVVYDLDENWNFEILDGKSNGISYMIPFRNIKSIIPENSNSSEVILKYGETFHLADGNDVNNENSGILIFTNKEAPLYIDWKQLGVITFR
ncbi:MAG: hypothetical protein ACEPOV_11065 [Hyphomicrobiales bacterium]